MLAAFSTVFVNVLVADDTVLLSEIGMALVIVEIDEASAAWVAAAALIAAVRS